MAGYYELREDIQGYLSETSAEFVAMLDSIIEYGQARICRELPLSELQVEDTGSFVAGSCFVARPSTMIAMVQFSVVVPGIGAVPLRPRDAAWLTAFWADRSATASQPKYWGLFDDDNLIVAPTPATDLSWRMMTRKVKSPLSASNLTNEITSRHYSLLLYACCERGAVYLGDDRRKEALASFSDLFAREKAVHLGNEVDVRTDSYTERKPPPGMA